MRPLDCVQKICIVFFFWHNGARDKKTGRNIKHSRSFQYVRKKSFSLSLREDKGFSHCQDPIRSYFFQILTRFCFCLFFFHWRKFFNKKVCVQWKPSSLCLVSIAILKPVKSQKNYVPPPTGLKKNIHFMKWIQGQTSQSKQRYPSEQHLLHSHFKKWLTLLKKKKIFFLFSVFPNLLHSST